MSLFSDIAEELCDGNDVLVNKVTGREYDCSRDVCPGGSYCHKVGEIYRCCGEGRRYPLPLPSKQCFYPDG